MSRQKKKKVAFLLALSLLLASLPCHAQINENTDENYERARKLYGDAILFYETGSYKEALGILLESYELNPRSTTILYIARCYRHLDKRREALRYYRRYMPAYELEARINPHPPAVAQEVKTQIRRLSRKFKRKKKKRKQAKPVIMKSPPPDSFGDKRLLAVGVTTAALALSFEIAAWASYAEAEQYYSDDDEFASYRDMVIAGHVLAITLAMASGISFYYFVQSRSSPRAANLWIMPTHGGVSVAGSFRF